MIVLVPTYKRTEVLPLVLRSVLACDVSGIDERVLVLVVNNYFPSKDAVDGIVSGLACKAPFSLLTIHRDPTLPAIQSWFSAIAEEATEGEVVMLLGDDDLMLPWGIKRRYEEITRHGADMLLSDFYQRLFFFRNATMCWMDGSEPTRPGGDVAAVPWQGLPARHPEASFLSNHCYRYTAGLRKGLERALSWCKEQNWVPESFATGNLPLYLPYAIQAEGGKVVALDQRLVVRGCIVEQMLQSEYADGGNTAFYCLLVFDTFNNAALHGDIGRFAVLRGIYRRAYFSDLVSVLLNPNVSLDMLRKTIAHSRIGFAGLFSLSALNNFKSAIRTLVPAIRAYRVKAAIRGTRMREAPSVVREWEAL